MSRIVALVPALAAALLVVAGCAVVDEVVAHEKEQHFDAYADQPQDGDLAFVPPDWMPDDAVAIDVRSKTDGPGRVMRYTSSTAPSGCTQGALHGDPMLRAGWLPSELPEQGSVCGMWRVGTIDDVTYAWTTL